MEVKNIREHRTYFAVLQNGRTTQTASMSLQPREESGPKANEHPKSDQVLFVVEGEVVAEIGDERQTLREGDVVIVPAGIAHRFSNESNEAALTLNVYGPPAY